MYLCGSKRKKCAFVIPEMVQKSLAQLRRLTATKLFENNWENQTDLVFRSICLVLRKVYTKKV